MRSAYAYAASMQTTQKVPQQLLSPAELAEELGIPVATVRGWIHRGGDLPPSATIGSRRYFRRRDVDAWLDAKFESTEAAR